MITIVDYGLGNLASVRNMIKKVGGEGVISKDPEVIRKASKLILPGVGAFGVGMKNLTDNGLKEALLENAGQGTKVMGICLGAQLLTKHSEENNTDGLGLINAQTKKFVPSDQNLKVPHMGWYNIAVNKPDHPLFKGIQKQPRYYFVHSYYMSCEEDSNLLCSCTYEHPFAAGIVNENVAGFQFHPEKSHVFGMKIMENFINW
jgi:glutamine amidotransferase